MRVLIVAEHNGHSLSPSVLHVVNAVGKLGEVDLLVAGENVAAVADEAKKVVGVCKVLTAEAHHYKGFLAEELAPLLVSLAGEYKFIASAASAFGKNLLPRVAAQLDCSQISDLIEIVNESTFVRPMYAGNALEIVECQDQHLMLTIRATAFEPVAAEGGSAVIEAVTVTPVQGLSEHLVMEMLQTDRPELKQAKAVIAGGRALQSEEQFNELLMPLADVLDAAVGSTRAAVDAGYAPNDSQVGQTGKVIAPDLYIGVGLSGAIQHTAGILNSKVIVAINKDPDAPIFNVADFGLVEDVFTAVPELTAALKAHFN